MKTSIKMRNRCYACPSRIFQIRWSPWSNSWSTRTANKTSNLTASMKRTWRLVFIIYMLNLNQLRDNLFVKFLKKYFPFCGVSIAHAQLFDMYVCEYDRNRALLEVVHDLFQQQTNLDTILFRIMQKAQALLKCRRCSVLLILDKDDQSTERTDSRKAFDLIQNLNPLDQRRHRLNEDTI